ncbi:MAG: EAL domain-containing protein [Blastomonas sp.]
MGFDRLPISKDSPLAIGTMWPMIIIARTAVVLLLVLSGNIELPTSVSLASICLATSLLLDIGFVIVARGPLGAKIPPAYAGLVTSSIIAVTCWTFSLAIADLTEVGDATAIATSLLVQIGSLLVMLAAIGSHSYLMLTAIIASAAAVAIGWRDPSILGGTSLFATTIFLIARYRKNREKLIRDDEQSIRLVSDRARLLLADYENSGRGWFWETDRQGRLTYLSTKVATDTAGSRDALIGQMLNSVVATPQDNSSGERTLGFHLTARTAFTDLSVRVANIPEERWWSMSGTPFYNDLGQFTGFRGHGTDLTEVRRSQDEVKQLARYDNLTGLANRLYIKEIFGKALVNARNQPNPCSIFMLDLDRFKQVNDTLGHAAGDVLLKQVSERLTRTIGQNGQVGRLGGDEFFVVLPGIINDEKLAEIAQLVINNLSHPYMVEGNQIVIGASVGVVTSDGKHREDADAMMRNADLALYSAKENGRGTYRFYHESMHESAKERRRLEEDLRTALGTGGLSLAYQPVVHAASEVITGYEALARWEHPEAGPISPGLFISIAEEAGLITQLGEWVLRTACADAASWPGAVRVAVNVSPIQFADPAFPTIVLNTLAQSGLAPERLELEITETVFLDGGTNVEKIFDRLKGIGVRLALDDFGTGYSALGYLKKAPVDKIKIDQSFVRGAVSMGGPNSAIVKSIVTLADALDMETTAEGAETLDELELIRALGCSHVQGYVYGKPMSTDAVREMLEAHDGKAVASGYKSSRQPRHKVLRTIGVFHDDYCYKGKIRNISSGGALIEGLWDVPEGTRFEISLAERVRVAAITRWSTGDIMGVQFIQPIDIDRFHQSVPPRVVEGPIEPVAEQRQAS